MTEISISPRELTLKSINGWRKQQLIRSQFSSTPISLRQTSHWALEEGRISHDTGAFFSIVGLRFNNPNSDREILQQPYVLQPEIGTLGFMVDRSQDEVRVLVQAKIEPGNPGGVQLAPSFQCTESNYLCRHGGSRAPYFECFHGDDLPRFWGDSRQSEQGTLFYDKYNRNAVVEVAEEVAQLDLPAREAWRWIPISHLCSLLPVDLLFNTDARSVIASCDWEVFCKAQKPFGRWEGTSGFGAALLHSYESRPGKTQFDQVSQWLEEQRVSTDLKPSIVPLEALSDWIISDEGVAHRARQHSVSVGYFRVHALDREVPKWDQPLIKLSQQGSVTLVAQEHDGVLRFLVRVSHEPGFANSAQLSATDQTYHAIKQNQNGVIATSVAKWSADPDRVQLSCVMSEEGSRFHWGINQYRILWVPSEESVPVDERFRWMTLGEITELKKISGVFTNEFRSALSLLVHFI